MASKKSVKKFAMKTLPYRIRIPLKGLRILEKLSEGLCQTEVARKPRMSKQTVHY